MNNNEIQLEDEENTKTILNVKTDYEKTSCILSCDILSSLHQQKCTMNYLNSSKDGFISRKIDHIHKYFHNAVSLFKAIDALLLGEPNIEGYNFVIRNKLKNNVIMWFYIDEIGYPSKDESYLSKTEKRRFLVKTDTNKLSNATFCFDSQNFVLPSEDGNVIAWAIVEGF